MHVLIHWCVLWQRVFQVMSMSHTNMVLSRANHGSYGRFPCMSKLHQHGSGQIVEGVEKGIKCLGKCVWRVDNMLI